jgi:dihydroflavonol-4-reductase
LGPDATPAAERPTYLVTGATGFLGRHLLHAVRRQVPQARLLVLVRDARSWEGQAWRETVGEVEVVVGPLFPTDSWSADPRLGDLRGIFHLAAEVKHTRSDVAGMVRTNVEGTASMVRLAAEKRCRLLFVSTSGTVACSTRPGRGVYEDAPYCEAVVGGWPYYASKIRAEKEASRLARELGVELVVFRPPVLLGPADHRFRSTGHVLRLLRGRLPFIVDGGMHFVDVRDAADAMVRAMRRPDPRPVYHLSGTASTLSAFFRMVAEEAGLTPSWRVLPGPLVRLAARLNEAVGSPLHVVPDPVVAEMAAHHWAILSRHAEADLAYRSRPPEQTIADTVSWLRRNHPDLRADTPAA